LRKAGAFSWCRFNRGDRDPAGAISCAVVPVEDSASDTGAGMNSEASSLWRRGREYAAAHPTATAVSLYGLVAIAAAIAAYFAIFTTYASYDDEGTLLVTIKAFAHGDALYRDIYTPYGPFYYELFGGLSSLTGIPVSTDASRIVVIIVWVASSAIYGVTVQRLTDRLLLGIVGMIVSFAVLQGLVSEPMHPHGLATLLLAGFLLLAVRGLRPGVVLSDAVAGALLGALLLTKINLGIFAVAAVVLAAVLTVEPLYRRRWLRLPVILAFLALPIFIVARDLDLSWVRDFALLQLLGVIAILIAASPWRPTAGAEDRALGRWLLAAAIGAVVMIVTVLVTLILTGPSPADIYDGMISQALRIRDAALAAPLIPPAATGWGIAAVAAATLTVLLRPSRPGKPSIWPGLLRIAAGLTIWFTIAVAAPFSFGPSASRDTLPLLLAWVAAIPPVGFSEPPQMRFLRVLIPALAVTEVLQVYPVAGTQLAIAAVTFVPVGALCVVDGLRSLQKWAAVAGADLPWRLGIVTTVVIVALAGKFGYEAIVRPGVTDAQLYREEVSLPFPNSSLMRMPVAQVEVYEGLVDLLHRHHCTTFAGYPSLNSLYLWSSIEAPRPQVPGPWMLLLDDPTQQRIVDEMRASPRPCAIRDNAVAEGWLGPGPPPATPLANYLLNDFVPVDEIGGIQFMLPKRSG
jgi:hypothetical protein